MGTWLAEHAMAVALSVAGGFIAAFLAKKTGNILDAIEVKLGIDIDDKLEVRIQEIVKKVVLSVSQTFVSGLKENGKFDDEKKKEALNKAVKEAGDIIFKEIGVKKDEKELRTAIEAVIGEQKEVEKIVKAASQNEAKGCVKRKKK